MSAKWDDNVEDKGSKLELRTQVKRRADLKEFIYQSIE